MFTINCKGKLLSLDQPVVMGILNITPDSFYEGHLDKNINELLQLAATMITDGALILDIGGQSSKPGSSRISAAEESARVLPVVEAIHKSFPQTIISIDTYYAAVAKDAVALGASIVNDISSGSLDTEMISTVASLNVPYIIMHMQGTPETMQQQPFYDNVVKEVLDFFIAKTDECKKADIKDIIIDVGFGFGKNRQHNFSLLKNMPVFQMLERPVLAGLSRKGMIYKTLNTTAAAALNGTTALNMLALNNGASILRVHDVKEAIECIRLFDEFSKA
ncbi:MAG: dihydropteroate synthase [Ferruginibacter sp.]